MRIPVLAANWKMFKTGQEAQAYVRELSLRTKGMTDVEIVVAPPAPWLALAAEAARNSPVGIAAQNMHFEADGAFTGEISARMIRDAGASYVILGHSERRRLFGETDEGVARKIRAALAADLIPIVCIGETLEERERGETFDVVDRQLRAALAELTPEKVGGLILAYEPVWAIGTGRVATPAEAEEVHQHVRSRLAEWFGGAAAAACRILYGGSVKPENIAELIALGDVDGALVGGASLDVNAFFEIISRSR